MNIKRTDYIGWIIALLIVSLSILSASGQFPNGLTTGEYGKSPATDDRLALHEPITWASIDYLPRWYPSLEIPCE